MPNNKENQNIQEVPQVRDVTAAKTVFMPAESYEDLDIPVRGHFANNVPPKPVTFLDRLRWIIESINRQKRVRNNGGFTNLNTKEHVTIKDDGGALN